MCPLSQHGRTGVRTRSRLTEMLRADGTEKSNEWLIWNGVDRFDSEECRVEAISDRPSLALDYWPTGLLDVQDPP